MKVKKNHSKKLKIDLDTSTLTYLQNAKEVKTSGGNVAWFAQAQHTNVAWFTK